MKKAVYYISPFIVIPIIFLICSLLESYVFSDPAVMCVLYISLILFAALIGALSQSKARFDYIITAIIPLSVFFSLFVLLYFDEGCDGSPQLSLHHALNIEYYRTWLPVTLSVTVTSFVFSFNGIRRFIRNK